MVVFTAFGIRQCGFMLPREKHRSRLNYDGHVIRNVNSTCGSEFPPIAYHYDGNGFTLSRNPIPFQDVAFELDQEFCSHRFRIINGVVGVTDVDGYTTASDMADVFFC